MTSRQHIHDLRDKIYEKSIKLELARMLGNDTGSLKKEVDDLMKQLTDLGENVDGTTRNESKE